MKIIRYCFVFVFLTILSTGIVSAQSTYSLREGITSPLFSLDYAGFKGDVEGKDRLEIYYRIYNSDLLFVKKGGVFEAEYDVIVAVNDKKNRPIASKTFHRKLTTEEYARTMSFRDYRIGQVTFSIPAEEYKLQCILNDKNSGRSTKRDMKADLTKYDNRNPQLSDIQFVHAVQPAGEDTTFTKGDKDYVPDVRRIYGGDTTATVRTYFEVYRGSGNAEEAQLKIYLVDFNDNSVYSDDELIEFGDRDMVPVYREIPLKGIKGGEYQMELTIIGKRGRDLDKVEGPITIHWTPQATILNDPEKGIGMLKYIATGNEMDSLKEAATAEERLSVWHQFWDSRDPSPGTPDNEVKDDYYDRIEFANQNFSILQREGWRTDRGMIFIQYGPPDQIEDHPFEIDSKAYQIWFYYRSGNQVREFLFVDDFGNNDYVLQYPYDGINH